MKLFKYEGYKVVISEEALSLKVFKQIWNRDKSNNKDRALSELSYVYFMVDPRSDYQYIIDEEERSKAIIEGEGLSNKWKPDKLVKEAMQFYSSFKPTAALLLDDTRAMIEGYRKKLRQLTSDMTELDVKEIKALGDIIKIIPTLVKDLDAAEKSITAELKNSNGKVRGQKEKSILEDGIW